MKHYFFLLLLVLGFSVAKAQGNGGGFERIHAAKVAYITDQIHLNADQAARFWPVYNRYESEVRTVRQAYHKQDVNSQQGVAQGDDGASMDAIDNNLEYQEKVLNLKKNYKDQFLKVISASQLAQLYDAERGFRKMLVEQMREKHNH